MNGNTLGIIAVSVVALGGITAVALHKRNKPEPQLFRRTATHEAADGRNGIVLSVADASNVDWTKIKEILNDDPVTAGSDPRISLFRIRHFTKGKPDDEQSNNDELKDEGTLPLTQLFGDRTAIVTRLKKKGTFTGYAFQIGVGAEESYRKYPTNSPNMPQAHGKINILESREMVEEVNAVLNPPSP